MTGADDNDRPRDKDRQESSGVRRLARLLESMPSDAVEEFRDALGSQLILPAFGVTRRRRLHGMLEFLGAHRRPPTESEYTEASRTANAALPEGAAEGVWMPATTLIEAYGTWAKAVAVAASVYARGTAAAAPASFRSTAASPSGSVAASRAKRTTSDPRRTWTEDEAIWALEEARSLIGRWPDDLDLRDLRAAGEDLKAACGYAGLDLPGPAPVKSLFGSHAEYVATAKRRQASRSLTPTVQRGGPEMAPASLTSASMSASVAPPADPAASSLSTNSQRGRTKARRRRSKNIRTPSR